MRFRLFFSVLVFAASAAFAQAPAQQTAVTGDRAKRESKKWGWVGQAGDFYFGNQNSMGIGGGFLWYLDGKSILSAEIGAGTNTDFWNSIQGDTVNGGNVRLGAYYTYFVTDRFYFKGGLEDRAIHYKVTHYPVLGGGTPYEQTADIRVFSLWFGLGNHWEIRDHLVIGCDWFGISVPFANSGFKETDTGPEFSRWDLKERLTRGAIDVARFYVGMSF